MSPNLKAFLDMIAVSEGTKGRGDDGYNVIVGGSLFTDYSDHPKKLIWIRDGLASTAAGRYQLLGRYWSVYKKQLNLQDFSPASQDAVAIQQIKERKALDDIEKGYIAVAIDKCKNIWASLPGAGYGQHENKIETLLAAYKTAGGSVA
jgi:muramidase (phage lysozyme)